MDIEGAYLNKIKSIYDKLMENILNCEKLKAFPLRSGISHEYPLSSLVFSIVLVFLAIAIRK